MAKAFCRYVALLRAVNGGQINMILKDDLPALFTEAEAPTGFSGNTPALRCSRAATLRVAMRRVITPQARIRGRGRRRGRVRKRLTECKEEILEALR